DNSSSFRCCNRCQLNLVHQKCFNELGLGKGRHDLDQRFVRKDNRAFGHGIDITGETELPQTFKKGCGKSINGSQISDRLVREGEGFQIVKNVFQTAGDKIISRRWQPSNEQIKYGEAIHAFVEIRLQHGQFVEISKEGCVRIADPGRAACCHSKIAPAFRMSSSAYLPSSGLTFTARVPSTMT